jgi:hypothetical protein
VGALPFWLDYLVNYEGEVVRFFIPLIQIPSLHAVYGELRSGTCINGMKNRQGFVVLLINKFFCQLIQNKSRKVKVGDQKLEIKSWRSKAGD